MKSFFILPTNVYEGKYDNNSVLDDFVKVLINKISSNDVEPNDYPKSLAFQPNQLPKIFYNFLNESIEEVLFLEKIKYNEFEISHMWINVHVKKWNSHRFHVHKNSFFSGVYYYDTMKNDSLTFLDRNEKFDSYFHLETRDNKPYGQKKFEKEVSNGDLLVFRSDLMHGVKTFESDKNKQRTSISFNIDLKGIGSESTKTYR